MKKILNSFLVVSLFSFAVIGCNNSGKDDTTDAVPVPGTNDTTTATNMTTDNAEANTPTADIPKDSTGTTAVKPNPAKKGKKGSVVVSTGDNKAAGDMEAKDQEGYYTNVYPSYPGGDKAIGDFFEKNLQYPAEASDNGVEGTVNISFTVDENGKIGAPKTVNQTIGYGLEEEALRVFKKMPSWKPGALKGKNVKTKFTLPVKYQLAD